MNYEHLTILLPCHSLEDFPLHYVGDQAASLLHAWTALWHPTLINAAGQVPDWARADEPPQDLGNRLMVIPLTARALLLAGWTKRARGEGAVVIDDFTSRDEIIKDALAALDSPPDVDADAIDADAIGADLVADFLALGYAYLQEELLTRQMRYMSNLDEGHFQTETVAAAKAACSGDVTEARKRLQACFDVLAEARDRFYPVDAFLLDLLLIADSTPPKLIVDELNRDGRVNLIAPSRVLRTLCESDAGRDVHLADVLKEKLADGTCSVAGGDLSEDLLPVQPVEMTAARLRQAEADYRELLGMELKTFARRRFGLTPVLPQTLARCGFSSALHFTLDDGQFPRGEQARARWRGPAPSGVGALTRIPLDAAAAETFSGFCERMGETMDLDHVATLVFARWPGRNGVWLDDIRRAGKYAPVLGRFVTLTEYFEAEGTPATSKFGPERYRSPYLKQAIIRREDNPLSRVANAYESRQVAEDANTLAVMAKLLEGGKDAAPQLERTRSALAEIDRQGISEAAEKNPAGQEPSAHPDSAAKQAILDIQTQLGPKNQGDSAESANAIFVFNPHTLSRRVVVKTDGFSAPPAAGGDSPVLVSQNEPEPLALVEVPPCGYAWVKPGSGVAESPSPAKKRGLFRRKVENPSLVDEESLTLRNEFFEVRIDRHTGGIASVRDYHHRGARLSQQLALRQKSEGASRDDDDSGKGDDFTNRDDTEYSVMSADEISVVSAGLVRGGIRAAGRLLDHDGNRLAGFEQTVTVTRGAPIIELSLTLDVDVEPRPDPWNSYYACRFAWPDLSLLWSRSVGMWVQDTELKRMEAPLFVQGDTGGEKTTILCGGLPYHRLVDERILDTQLVCRGETRREFRLGIGIDLKHPAREAVAFLSPDYVTHANAIPITENNAAPTSGWLFHIDKPNVTATHWDILSEDGAVRGFRVRLIETEARSTRVKLRCMRDVKSARAVDFVGGTLAELQVEGDAIQLELDACEWVEVQAHWA